MRKAFAESDLTKLKKDKERSRRRRVHQWRRAWREAQESEGQAEMRLFRSAPVKPQLAPDVVRELELYSVNQLRQARADTDASLFRPRADTGGSLVRLRNATVLSEIEEWVTCKEAVEKWTERRDTQRFRN
jgi:hypothetical protein